MICQYCGAQNPDLAAYCSICGRIVAIPQQPSPSQFQTGQYGQDNYPPPPPPDMGQPQQMTGPAQYPSTSTQSDASDRNKFCPDCNKRLYSGWIPTRTCVICGTTFHLKCFSEGNMSCTSKSAIALFPNRRKQIVDRVLASKMAHTWTPGQLRSMPEAELIKDTRQELCRFCAPIAKENAPKAGRDLEKAGRYADAGDLFEEFGMFELAGAVRKKANAQVVTNITIDINQLLEKLKSGGLVSVYKCPNCGASIKISGETSTTQLSKCEFCGTVLRTDDLIRFIQDILG